MAETEMDIINRVFLFTSGTSIRVSGFQIYLPVRTNHVSSVLNDLTRCQLH